ncbi:aldehyde dehydrogenase family protein [Streptomyces sp. NBC_00005]|uniref:aldehyde dehydrogenase family protein n=1 Tax=Streptomyces sp. NBC_00005 TaxID=2903609 RepID=UPI003252812C
MTVQSADPALYPHALSESTVKTLRRPLFGHVIEGETVPALDGATMPVIDPATGIRTATAAAGTSDDVTAAVRSARTAFDDGRWRLLAPLEKERRLRRLAALLAERADLFGEIDVIDAGLLRGYTTFVVDGAVAGVEYYAGWPTKLHGTIPAVPSEFAVYEMREPIGVIGMIMPWNGPTFVLGFVAAALAAGNAVVLKPAEQTPLSAVLMAELALEAGIPPGVFNVVQGLGETVGAALVTAPEVDAVSFTGSVATGSAIQAAAAARVKRVSLELGGKSAFIVFPDADLEAAATSAAMGVWGASGQVCTAATRVLAHRDIRDEFVSLVLDRSRDLRLGSGFDPATQMGPVVSADQLARVQSYVDIGRAEGAELVLGGERHGDVGFFHQPTVFTGVRNDMRIAREEIFGPVMSVLDFGSEDEAYAIANDSDYGLAAGVWTENLSLAHRASRALRTGTVWVNTYQMVYPTVPYGGVKLSGHGRALGAAALDDLTVPKSVWMKVGS